MTTTGPAGLDAVQRSMLERLVIRARILLENDLAAQVEGRFGIHLDGTIEDETALPDDTTDKTTRRDLEQIVAHLRTQGEDPPSAVGRLLREAAFTHLNRLVAIRIAEAISLLPESLANGPQSRGFRDLGEIMPILAGDYRAYVRLCGDELAADAPALFDPRNPLLALEPSTAAFDNLVAWVATPGMAEIWSSPDTLGWAYQFFNTGDERREMREAPAPRNSRELAVRNQFFTPRYVVDFLVQNTIGRRLIENDPTSPLLDELPLLVDPPTERGPSLELDEVKCLDPACGSGHFLLGCYDVLERAWELAGIAASESAPKIVLSLWGVDIDSRCAQVASAAIVLRARRHCRDLVLPRPNIVTARGLPGGAAALPPDLQLTAGQRALIDRISEVLADAPLLGTLLKAEEALDQEIRHGVFGGKAGTLELTDEAAEATERELLSHLRAIADQASSSVVERLLAAEADDALRLVDVVRQRYDAVLMNPPFGDPVPDTKRYLRAAYAWLPTKDSNLLAAFVGRGLELCRKDGYLGAITSRAGMFLTTFESWRREVILGNRLVTFADLGLGVMEQALVEAAAYVIGPGRPDAETKATFVRLLKDTDRAGGLIDAISAERDGQPDRRIYSVRTVEFESLPGVPLAYWVSPSIRRLFVELPSLEGAGPEARQGLATGEDFRFVRVSWEVDPGRTTSRPDETRHGMRWFPFAKGGEYSPYWADVHLLVDYERDGETLRGLLTSRVQNKQYYFRPGLTWPLRTASGFSPRILPAGCVFGHKGPAILGGSPLELLAWLTSRLASALMATSQPAGDETSSGTASKSYEVGLVQRLPWPGPALDEKVTERLAGHSMRIAERRRSEDKEDETARLFVAPGLSRSGKSFRQAALDRYSARSENAIASIIDAEAAERILGEALALDADAFAYLDEEVGPHPGSYPTTRLDDEDAFARLFELPMDQLIDQVIAERGGTRAVATMTFVADRRIEVLAHALRRHPTVFHELVQRRGLLPPGELRRSADDLFSYLVGVSFGRWDVRLGRDPSLAPAPQELFDPIPVCPPGMLVGADALPITGTPSDYSIDLPPARLLIDEPGHTWDIEASVLRTANALLDEPAAIVAELLEILGRKTVRDHLRKQFFKDHLSRYSKSRRKAPIYWPLTVPSKNWGVWVYAPMLTRETLYSVASEARRRERLAGGAIARLRREQHEGGAGRPVRKVAEELDAEERLAEELRRFRAEAERVAGLGWEPDLDDGIVLCAAPLADLFPSWPEAKAARAELRKGKHEWATVAAWADQL
jgi:hypothetical protein